MRAVIVLYALFLNARGHFIPWFPRGNLHALFLHWWNQNPIWMSGREFDRPKLPFIHGWVAQLPYPHSNSQEHETHKTTQTARTRTHITTRELGVVTTIAIVGL